MKLDKRGLTLFPIFIGIVGTQFFGRIAILEILSLFWFLFFGGFQKLSFLFRQDFAFTGLFYVTSSCLLLSDLINSSTIEVLIKGVGAYLLFPTTLLFLVNFFNRNQLWIVLLVSSLASVFNSEDVKEYGLSQEAFKFGFSFALVYILLTVGICLVRYYPRLNGDLVAIISSMSIAFLAFWGNLRLLALCAFIALAVDQVFFLSPLRKIILNSRNKIRHLLFLLISYPLFLVILSILMTPLADLFLSLVPFDLFSQNALEKTLSQSSGSLGLLFGGRSEIFSSYLAWIEKPLLGWGSWAADPNDAFNLAGKILMKNLGYELDISRIILGFQNIRADGLIPTHSVLLSALVWAGLIGFLPLYICVCQFSMNLLESGSLKIGYCYPYVFVHVLCLWNLLFSPFGYSNRLTAACMMALAVAHLRRLKESNALAVSPSIIKSKQ